VSEAAAGDSSPVSPGDSASAGDGASSLDGATGEASVGSEAGPPSDAANDLDALGGAGSCGSTLNVGPTVEVSSYLMGTPATNGYALFVQGNATYVLNPNDTSWTVIQEGSSSGVTSPIPLPAGVASMKAVQIARSFDDSTLIFYEDASNNPFATFFDGTTFSTPIALPMNTVTVSAGGNRALFAIDSSSVLWDGSSGTFLNRGALPVPPDPDVYPAYLWGVTPSNVVAVVYSGYTENDAMMGVLSQTYQSGAWVGPVTVGVEATNPNDTYYVSALSVAADGSIHVLYGVEYSQSSTSFQTYARSQTGATWESHSAPNFDGADTLAANSYADVGVLWSGAVPTQNGNSMTMQVLWESLDCNPQTIANLGWTATTVQNVDPSNYPLGSSVWMAVNAAGAPAFVVWQAGNTAVVTSSLQ
jgi:hypothetical protein